MKTIKYKCCEQECGHVFEGDMSTTQCPECGSENIKPLGSKIPKWVWIALGIIAVFVFIILIMKGCSHEDKIIATLADKSNDTLMISVEGVASKTLVSKYRIKISNNNNADVENRPFLRNSNSISICKSDFLPGVSYYFSLEDLKGNVPKNFQWKGINTYYHPFPPVSPKIDRFEYKCPDYKSQTYGEVIIVLKEDSTQMGVEYYLDSLTQDSNIFHNITAGSHLCRVTNADGLVDTMMIKLPKIEPLPQKITIEKMNRIFSKLHNKDITLGEAWKSIGGKKDIDLKKKIDNKESLFELMRYTRLDGAPEYQVVSCEYNDHNEIISGTILVERKH